MSQKRFDIDIRIEDPLWRKSCARLKSLTEKAITTALDITLPVKTKADISIVYCDDTFIRKLNKSYRQKDKPTNVLSFPMTDSPEIKKSTHITLGDIILARETIEREAEEQEKALKAHLSHLLVHGCLHLLHYDHETEKQAKTMETLEIKVLAELGIKNPYEI